MNGLTKEQAYYDERWDKIISLCKEMGFVVHKYDGTALISKHEIQLRTRKETDYFMGQIINGNCLKKFGYEECGIKNCSDCFLNESK